MPEPTLTARAARAALAAHFAPDQVTADLDRYSPAEVWQQRVRHDNTGRLAHYKPRDELDSAQLTCRFIIPSDEVWPTALADLGPHCPLGLWVRGGDQLPRLTARAVAVTGNRNATEQALLVPMPSPPPSPRPATPSPPHSPTASTPPPTGPPPRPDGQRSPSCRAAWTAPTRTTTPRC